MAHDHNHEHGHEHTHTHTVEGLSDIGKVTAILHYTVNHNSSHMKEITDLAELVEATGHNELAEKVQGCVALYKQIDTTLREVLEHFEEGH